MNSREFDLKRKHIFILTSAGKPIFSRHGDEQELVTTFGLLQAIISIVSDSGDSLKCIRSKRRTIVYFLRNSLYFVMIASTKEPETVLNLHLEFMYSQILLILTSRVHDVLENNSSKDLRELLGPETNRLLYASCKNDITSPYIAFQCVKSFAMLDDFREEMRLLLQQCVDASGSALGMIVHEDSLINYCSASLCIEIQDVMLLCHFISNATSLRTHDQNWVPICLPNFNSKAYMQAYICQLKIKDPTDRQIDLLLVLVAAEAESSAFKNLHDNRLIMEEEMNRAVMSSRLIYFLDQQEYSVLPYLHQSLCLHFFFKYRPSLKDGNPSPIQGVGSEFDVSLQCEDSQERIWIAYQNLALCMRAGTSVSEYTLPSSLPKSSKISSTAKNDDADGFDKNILTTTPLPDHALNYVILESRLIVVSLASSESELYVTFPGTMSTLDACGLAKYLSSSLKADAANLFLT